MVHAKILSQTNDNYPEKFSKCKISFSYKSSRAEVFSKKDVLKTFPVAASVLNWLTRESSKSDLFPPGITATLLRILPWHKAPPWLQSISTLVTSRIFRKITYLSKHHVSFETSRIFRKSNYQFYWNGTTNLESHQSY